MYNSFETILILSLEKQRQIQKEAEWFRQAVEQQPVRNKRIRVKFSGWLGRILINAGEKMIQHAN